MTMNVQACTGDRLIDRGAACAPYYGTALPPRAVVIPFLRNADTFG